MAMRDWTKHKYQDSEFCYYTPKFSGSHGKIEQNPEGQFWVSVGDYDMTHYDKFEDAEKVFIAKNLNRIRRLEADLLALIGEAPQNERNE